MWTLMPILIALAAELAPVTQTPDAYGDHYLVILSAKVERGHNPDGLSAAAALPGTQLARLDSSAFKNLMPCYEIVVAGHFAELTAAKQLSAALKRAGIDHTIKNAGRYVGERPEMAGACAALRSPGQKGGRAFAFGNELGVPVPVPTEVAVRALEGAPAPKAVSETAWRAPLSAKTIGPWSVGDKVHAYSYTSGALDCAVTGFVAGIVGEPHFGWREAGAAHPPPCGETLATAELSCAADFVAAPTESPIVGMWMEDWKPTQAPDGAWKEQVDAALRQGKDAARADSPLKVTWKSRQARLGDAVVNVVLLELMTGTGEWFCGGDDHYATWVGVLNGKGNPAGPMVDATGAEVVGILRPTKGVAPSIHLQDIITGSHRLVGPDGEQRQERGFCDCPC